MFAYNYKLIFWKIKIHPLFKDPPLISYRRKTNILVRSKLNGIRWCYSRCSTCKCINTYTKLTGPKASVSVPHQSSCITAGIVYRLSCERCNQLCIRGNQEQTCWSLCQAPPIRIKDFSILVVRHFNRSEHSINDIIVCIADCYYMSIYGSKQKETRAHLQFQNLETT